MQSNSPLLQPNDMPDDSNVRQSPSCQPSRHDVLNESMEGSYENNRLRKWQVFPGRNKFFCDGRIIMARSIGILYITVGLILVTVALFFSFDCRLTLVSLNYGFLIPIFAGLMFIFVMACLFRTAWSDPGIIPRASPTESSYIEKQLQERQASEAAAAGQQGYRPPPRTLDVVVNGVPIKLKYCFTCRIFRPPRASHCSLCDNCVENFDHHCPWVGNCVGRRNYKYFYLFVTSLSFLCLYVLAFSVVNLVLLSNEKEGFLEALKISPGSVIEIIICFFSIWSVMGLSGFHSYLIAQGITTNEDIKGTWSKKRNKDQRNPFNQGGFCANSRYILCGPVPPSVIDRRGYVTESYERDQVHEEHCDQNGATYVASAGQTAPMSTMEQFDGSGANYPRQPQYVAGTQLQNGSTQNQMSSTDRILSTPLRSPPQFNSNNSAGGAGNQPCYPCDSMSTPIISKDTLQQISESGHPNSINSPRMGDNTMQEGSNAGIGYMNSNL